MATIIRCTHKYDDVYNYNIEKDIEDENGFEVDVLVRVFTYYKPARILYDDHDHPAESGFKIDYDSFEIEYNQHSEPEKETIENWVSVHKDKGTFEDAFGKDYFEID